MPLTDLFDEAERQLNVCNSCRYCAGYCPVWPSLELRTTLSEGDITHLANLCHDCRDCFSACMYTAPHEFDLNPPRIFASVRERTYSDYRWPRKVPGSLHGTLGLSVGLVICTGAMFGLAFLSRGSGVLHAHHGGDPYATIAHPLLVTLFVLAAGWAGIAVLTALVRYWRDTHGRLRDLLSARAWRHALGQAAVLRHQTGAEEGCNYQSEIPSTQRRYAHQLVMYGFLLTFVATTSAGFMENFLGLKPPYDYLSVPVVSGTVGGVLATAGCWWLLALKKRSDPDQTTETMRSADVNLIRGLLVLMVSGIGVLLLRETPAFGSVFLIHIGAVLLAMLIAPYTKFFHFTYRLLAVYKDNFERLRQEAAR